MDEFKAFAKRIIIENIILLALGMAVLLAWGKMDYLLGWIWGSLGNIGYFLLLYRNLRKLAVMDEDKRQAQIRKTIGRRFAIIVIFIFISVIVPHIHVLAVVASFIAFKFLIYIDQFVVKRFILPHVNKEIS